MRRLIIICSTTDI